MSFERHGFLTEDMDRWRLEKRSKYPDHFKLVTDINQTIQGMLPLTGNIPRHINTLLICAFFVRALQSYQGAILMAERGLITEAVTLNRSTIETLFYLRAARVAPEFARDFGKSHVKTLNKVIGGHVDALERIEERDDSAPVTSDQLKSVLDYLKAEGVEPADLKIFRVAVMAGMEQLYRTDYALFSTRAHPTVLALEELWDKRTPMGEPTGIKWGPDKGEPSALPYALLQIASSGVRLILELNETFQNPTVTKRFEEHKVLHLKLLEEGELGTVW